MLNRRTILQSFHVDDLCLLERHNTRERSPVFLDNGQYKGLIKILKKHIANLCTWVDGWVNRRGTAAQKNVQQ